MAITELPTRTDPRYDFEIDLEERSFRFEFSWNDRSASWSFSLFDASDTLLLAGRKVVVGLPLLARFKDPRLPPGVLVAIDTSGQDLDPGIEDLGKRVKLVYTDLADWKAL